MSFKDSLPKLRLLDHFVDLFDLICASENWHFSCITGFIENLLQLIFKIELKRQVLS